MEDDNQHHNHHHHDDHDDEESRSGVGGSRWNPTKEQIEMLERIYSHEGVRTPSADQIQQITSRLRVYGHIEGKNVFYWFQNHKARQRQKQRLERLAANAAANHTTTHNLTHFSRFLAPNHYQPLPHHHYIANNPPANCGLSLNPTRPVFSASHHPATYHHHHYLPNPNAVICNPYYQVPQTNLGYYNLPHNNYSAPAANHADQGMINKRSSSSKPSIIKNRVGVPPGSTLSGYCAAMKKSHQSSMDNNHHDHNNQGMRTLNLFPVHPTGILEHKIDNSANNSTANSSATSSSSDTNMNHYDDGDQHQHPNFFDFFSSGHASSESG